MFQIIRPTRVTTRPFIKLFLLLTLAIAFLSACSKTEVTKEGACVDTADEGVFCLKLVNASNVIIRSLDRNSSASIIAIAKNADNKGLEGLVVTFDSDIAELGNQGTALTDSGGEATLTITAGANAVAGNVSASIEIDGNTLSVSYGFAIAGTTGGDTTTPEPTPVVVVDDPDDTASAVSSSVTGAIDFVAATPTTIVLRNTGGAGLSEFSTVQFRLIGSDGLPLENKQINFSLNTDIGGLDIDPTSAITNSGGLVSTTVQSGSVPTSIRVTATTQVIDSNGDTQTIFTQSDQLVVSTGIPDQNSFSLSISQRNPEAWAFDGVEVDITARLADHFNNFVPDGTSVYFTTEGGAIEPSCLTVGGACSVKWRSQDPRPADHRVTILATALGTESFQDTDSDGVYTLADGEPFDDVTRNGLYDEPFDDQNGNSLYDEPFVQMGNRKYDVGETFTDTTNGIYDGTFIHFTNVIIPAETFTDIANGQWDPGEVLTLDANSNGVFDDGDTFVDIANGKYDKNEPFVDAANGVWDPGESFIDTADNRYDLGDTFVDYNGNGVYDGNGNNPTGEVTSTAGEPTFTDSNNGNGLYDGKGVLPAGETYTEATQNTVFDGPGFPDLAEPYLDANENGKYDVDEMYVDTNNDGVFSAGDKKYNGILCSGDNNCSDKKTLHIRRSTNLVMSGSYPIITLRDSRGNIIYASNRGLLNPSPTGQIDISFGDSISLELRYSDSAGQVLPVGTSISVSTSVGKISGTTQITVANTLGSAYAPRGSATEDSERATEFGGILFFSLTDTDINESEAGALEIRFSTPTSVETAFVIGVRT